MRTFLSTLPCLCLCAALTAAPIPARAAQDATPQPVVADAVDGLVQFEFADPYTPPNVVRWLTEATESVFAELPPRDRSTWTINVRLRGHTRAYELSVAAHSGEQSLAPEHFVACPCGGAELTDAFKQRLTTVIEALETPPPDEPEPAAASEEPPPPEPTLLTPPPEPRPPAQPLPPPARGGVGALGGTGIGLMIAGAGAFAFGLTRAIQGESTQLNEATGVLTEYQTPATNTALGLGLVAALAGAAMITVDQVVCRNRPRGCKPAETTTWTPTQPFSLRF